MNCIFYGTWTSDKFNDANFLEHGNGPAPQSNTKHHLCTGPGYNLWWVAASVAVFTCIINYGYLIRFSIYHLISMYSSKIFAEIFIKIFVSNGWK